jgi:hypothetical protein
MFNDLRCCCFVVCFVDICGVVDYHCLNFLFIISSNFEDNSTIKTAVGGK